MEKLLEKISEKEKATESLATDVEMEKWRLEQNQMAGEDSRKGHENFVSDPEAEFKNIVLNAKSKRVVIQPLRF